VTSTSYSLQKINRLDTVNASTIGPQFAPTIVTFADGSGVVFYNDLNNNGTEGRILNAQGEPIGLPIHIESGFFPSAVQLANGNVVVAWTNTAIGDVEARVYTPNLQPVGAVLTLFDGTLAHSYQEVDLAATATGFAATAALYVSSTNNDIYIGTFAADGSPDETAVVPDISDDSDPSIAVLSNGNIVVSFTRLDPNAYASNDAVWVGTWSSTLGVVETISRLGYGFGSSLVARPDGTFVLAYSKGVGVFAAAYAIGTASGAVSQGTTLSEYGGQSRHSGRRNFTVRPHRVCSKYRRRPQYPPDPAGRNNGRQDHDTGRSPFRGPP
jgi:hypothetical protein